MFKGTFGLVWIALITGSLVVAGPAPAADSGGAALLVATRSGPVKGQLTTDAAAIRWLGVPYAEPPVAQRRWQAPQAHAAWTAPRDASAYGAACAQVGGPYGPPAVDRPWGAANVETFGQPVGHEDCLTLNLWRPAGAESGLPVIVFIHGGANVVGHSADPIYDGARLAAKTQALVVTINYRLGLFGWMSHPALEGGDRLSDSGNFGLLDIIEALRFVQANAAAFGGNPSAVTVMGESAGGGNIYALLASPLTEGLFQKAIVQSALIRNDDGKPEGAGFAQRLAAALLMRDGEAADFESATRLVADRGNDWLREFLRARPASELLSTQREHSELWRIPGFFGDGTVLPGMLADAYQRGAFQKMPMIVGMTAEESKLLFATGLKRSSPDRFKAMVEARPDSDRPIALDEMVSAYLLPSISAAPFKAMHRLFSRYLRHRLDGDLDLLSQYNPRVYAYRFSWNQGPEPWRTLYGASHGSDLPFVFGNFAGNLFSMEYSTPTRVGREALSDAMMDSIGAFIRHGDPNHAALRLNWRPWTPALGDDSRLDFDASDDALRLTTGR